MVFSTYVTLLGAIRGFSQVNQLFWPAVGMSLVFGSFSYLGLLVFLSVGEDPVSFLIGVVSVELF